MTIEEVLDACEGKTLIRHKGAVFFNTTDWTEAMDWEQRGECEIVPHYTLDDIELRKAKGIPTTPGWEVHILGACTPIWELQDGDEVNVTRDVLLEHVRARDGFSEGIRR